MCRVRVCAWCVCVGVTNVAQERNEKMKAELQSKRAIEEAFGGAMRHLDEIEKAVSGTRSLMKKAQSAADLQVNVVRSGTKLGMML